MELVGHTLDGTPNVETPHADSWARRPSLPARSLLLLLTLYRTIVSPLLPSTCRFVPSCSAYAREAVATHGARRGAWLAIRRVARCHPLGGRGHDPVP